MASVLFLAPNSSKCGSRLSTRNVQSIPVQVKTVLTCQSQWPVVKSLLLFRAMWIKAWPSFSTCVCVYISIYVQVTFICNFIYIQTYVVRHHCLFSSNFASSSQFPSTSLFLFHFTFEFYACGDFLRHISLFFLPSFPFLSYSGFSFFTFLSTCFCSKLIYNFSSVWLLLSLTGPGWPSTLLASLHTPRVHGLRSGRSCAPYFLKKKE